MDKKILDMVATKIVVLLSELHIDDISKVELMINITKFLDNNEYELNVETLRKKQE